MLKSIVAFIVTVLLILTCVGCGGSSRDKQKEDKSIKSILDKSITQTYDPLSGDFGYGGHYNFYAGTFNNTLKQLADWNNMTIELTCLTETAEGYAIFRIHDDKIGDYYLYFFCRFRSIDQDRADYDNWEFAGRAMKVSKRLAAKDFDGIKQGATIKDVSKVDPVTAISITESDYIVDTPILSCDTFHYTEDGILRITFERKSVNNEFHVSEIKLNSTYEVNWYDGTDIQCNETITQKIKPEHLPD